MPLSDHRPDGQRSERWRRILDGGAGEAFGVLFEASRKDVPWTGTAGGAHPDLTGRLVGRYRILHKLGDGGMGVVFAAQQENPERLVALKVLRAGVFADERQLRMFRREVTSLARLAHPGIAAIHDAGCTDEGLAYFAMELVEGEPLTRRLAHSSPPATRAEVEDRLGFFLGLCDAISHAHQRGVIHLDLKPSNIYVPPSGGTDTGAAVTPVKVLDFGVARLVGADAEATGTLGGRGLFGTLAYMSPEQAAGDPAAADVRSDIYALGVLLHELLAGAPPVEVSELPLHEAVRAIREREPARLGDLARSLRGDLETIVLKALAKDPGQRYQSVAALADDLQRYLRDLPITARAPSTAYQVRKIVRRHRLPIALAGLVAVSLLVAAGGTTFGLVRAKRAERLALAEAAAAERAAGFLEQVFRVADPSESRGAEVTARELLDRAVATIDEELGAEARLRGRLLATMGNAYRNLGLYRDARPLLEQAAALQEQTLAPSDLQLARTHFLLASLLRRLEDYPAAESHYRAALAVRERALPPDHADLAVSVAGLANLAVDRADYAAARPLYARALGILGRAVGQDDPRYAAMLSNLAIAEWNAGNVESAREHLERVVAIQRRTLPAGDLDLAWSLGLLALTYEKTGRLDEAQAFGTEALAIQESALGPSHPDLAETLGVLAELNGRRGDFAAAVAQRERALAIWALALGDRSTSYAMALDNLARDLGRLGRLAEAVAASESAGAILAGAVEATHPAIHTHLTIIGRLYLDSGRPAEALPPLRQALALREAALGAGHAEVAEVRELLERAGQSGPGQEHTGQKRP